MRSLSSRLELGFEDDDRARMVVYNDILDAGFLHFDIEFIVTLKYPKKGVDKKPNKKKVELISISPDRRTGQVAQAKTASSAIASR